MRLNRNSFLPTPPILLMAIMAFASMAATFDVTRIQPVADRNIHTGNKMLYERETDEFAANNAKYRNVNGDGADDDAAAAAALHNSAVLDVNEIPVRYDEAQLWRIYNISNHMRRQMMPLADIMENKYGRYY